MTLYIDTTKKHDIEIAIKDSNRVVAKKKFKAKYKQAEKLLPEINSLISKKGYNLKDIDKIEVNNNSTDKTSFTALRIGIITANTLGYALGIPVIGAKRGEKKFQPKADPPLAGKEVARGNNKFDIIKPVYSKEPNVTISKNN
ncbi:MAG: hypothetical protein ABIE43_04420 [Patescibacteria group bacterium]